MCCAPLATSKRAALAKQVAHLVAHSSARPLARLLAPKLVGQLSERKVDLRHQTQQVQRGERERALWVKDRIASFSFQIFFIIIKNNPTMWSPSGNLLLALAALCLLAAAPSKVAAESCHLREFDLCMTSAIVFVQQPAGTKVNEAEIEKQCALFHETEQCLDEYTERCMSPMQSQLVEFASGGLLKQMRDYCKKGSNLRKTYLKHGDCVTKQRKATNKCVVDFQAAVEKSTQDDTHWRERPKVMCW